MKRHAVRWIVAGLIAVIPTRAGADQLGVALPIPIGSTLTQGGAPNFADTFVTPYVASRSTVIRMWRAGVIRGLTNGGGVGAVGGGLQAFSSVAGAPDVGAGAAGRARPA